MASSSYKKRKSSLRMRMIFYFLLIAFANLFVIGELVFEISSSEYREEVHEKVDKEVQAERIQEMNVVLDDIVKKFVFMVFVLIFVSATILSLFVVQIVSPLQYMINVADKMSDGDMSLRINIKTSDELSDLGNLINDLSMNVQEIVAQIERLSYDLSSICKLHSKNINKHHKLPLVFRKETEALHKLSQEMILLKNMYVLYKIDSLKKHFYDENKTQG